MIMMTLLVLCSCSQVKRIQTNSFDIQDLAQEAITNYEGIIEATEQTPPRLREIVERSHQGISQQTEILEKAKDTILQTSQVVDATPKWQELIELGLWTALIVAVVIGAWYLGLGTVTRKLFGFIPEAKKEEAKLLREALDDESSTELKEVVAYLRAKDPELNRAYKAMNKNETKRKRPDQ